MAMYSEVGSLWHRWDLHVHTSASYDYAYKNDDADEKLVEALHNHKISAVAITDHFQIDAVKIQNLRDIVERKNYDITFFPGVELRTDKGANNLHIILIFSDTSDVFNLSNLFNVNLKSNLHKESDPDETIHWDFETILKFAKQHNAIISIHAGSKSNGIDQIKCSNALPVNEAIKDEIAKKIDFFELGKINDLNEYKKYVLPSTGIKPLIICSDCHDPRDYKSKANLWIKGDICFETLKQCVFQPQERVFIGDEPPVCIRARNEVTINQIDITPNEKFKGENPWFNQKIKINPGMVAIIGSKGSGKSALADILALGCHCNVKEEGSFLSDKKFGKKADHLSEKYNGTIFWKGREEEPYRFCLNDYKIYDENESIPLKAEYLPQSYIEKLCNDLGDSFQETVDKVIFSYLPPIQTKGKTSLHDLIERETLELKNKETEYKEKITQLNQQIIELEKKRTKDYLNSINRQLQQKQEELERLQKNKPKIIIKPAASTLSKNHEKIENHNVRIKELEGEITKIQCNIQNIDKQYEDLNKIYFAVDHILKEVENVKKAISGYEDKYNCTVTKNGKWETNIPIEEIKAGLRFLTQKREESITQLDKDVVGSLANKKFNLENKRQALIDASSEQEKKYQDYLQKKEEWETKYNNIIGNGNNIDSIKYYKQQKDYLENDLPGELENLYTDRKNILKSLYECKKELEKTYNNIFSPIVTRFNNNEALANMSISFSAQIKFNQNEFMKNALNAINMRYGGVFRGKEQSEETIKEWLQDTDAESYSDVQKLIDNFMDNINSDPDTSDKIVQNKADFYKYLYQLSYLDVSYKIGMDNKNINELSPGERGILLLAFFLLISKDTTPIIIDQPEDNLDNQSVFSKLVPAIKEAKKRRQIIIVTHNPNLAIACDAEQIIYAQMDKQKMQIHYTSGSIENMKLKQDVVDILEGTMPAFDLRRNTYAIGQNKIR